MHTVLRASRQILNAQSSSTPPPPPNSFYPVWKSHPDHKILRGGRSGELVAVSRFLCLHSGIPSLVKSAAWVREGVGEIEFAELYQLSATHNEKSWK